MFHYRICGLSVASDFALPGMTIAAGEVARADVRVRYGATPAALTGERRIGPTWQVAGACFLLQVPQVARFLVTGGSEVVVDLQASSTGADAAPFLLSTVFGVLLHQRGQLVLHAAVVAYRGQGLALCGATGAGKSTLAAALCRAGCDFVGDDLAAVRFDDAGVPTILPDGRRHRLWVDAAERLALTDRLGPPVRPDIEKFHVDPLRSATPGPTPLSAIFILREAVPPCRLELAPLALADAALLVRGQVFRSKLAGHLGRDAALFQQIAALFRRVRVSRLDRVMDFATLDDTVAALLAQVGEAA